MSANGGSPSPFSTIFNLVLADSMLDYEEETQYTVRGWLLNDELVMIGAVIISSAGVGG